MNKKVPSSRPPVAGAEGAHIESAERAPAEPLLAILGLGVQDIEAGRFKDASDVLDDLDGGFP